MSDDKHRPDEPVADRDEVTEQRSGGDVDSVNDVDVESIDSETSSTEHPDDTSESTTKALTDTEAHQNAEGNEVEVSEAEVNEAMAQQTEPASSAGRGLAFFALLLSLLAVAGAGFLGWLFYEEQRQITLSAGTQAEQTESIASTVDKQFDELAALRAQIEKLEKSKASEAQKQRQQLEALSAKQQESSQIVDSHARRLLSLTATTTDDWRVAEVDYLLRLANQRLLISSDAQTAISLIEAADQILIELADPRLLEVRKSIAEDRAALNLIAGLDIDGMFLNLAAIANQIDSLPVVSAPKFQAQSLRSDTDDAAASQALEDASGITASPANAEHDTTESVTSRIVAVFERGWLEIRSWFAINREGATIKPMLPPEQQYYLRANLKLLLNQAQIALLEKRPEPYRISLGTAIDWLRNYYPTEEPAIQATIEDLQTLAATDIAPELPDLSGSLLEIKSFINSRFNQSGSSKSSSEPQVVTGSTSDQS